MAGVNSLALPVCPTPGQSKPEKFPLFPPKKKKKKKAYTLNQKKKKMQILGLYHHEGKGNLLKFHSHLDSPGLRWTQSRHLQILCRGRPHLQGVLLTGVEQFLRAIQVTGNFILSHQSFSCRFTRWFLALPSCLAR